MNSITPISQSLTFHVPGKAPSSLTNRIASAVGTFFVSTVLFIQESIQLLANCFQKYVFEALSLLPPNVPTIEENASLAVRLNAYRELPIWNLGFLQRSIDLHRAMLKGEDATHASLDAFNENTIASLDLVMILRHPIRAFLFTDKQLRYYECPDFL